MKNSVKTIVSVLLSCCAVLNFVGCKNEKNTVDKTPPPNYTLDSYKFNTVYTNSKEVTLPVYNAEDPSATDFASYDVYSNIKDVNYIRLNLETDVNLVGYINYRNSKDASQKHSEKFYVKAGSTEFTTFLDAFRIGAFGDFEKIITTITFQNVDDTKEGHLNFKSLGISDRTYDLKEQLRITDGKTVLGTSCMYGGCITYLELLDEDVYEYMDSDGNICIDSQVDPDEVDVVNENVNFVNIFDLGREIQPSYYSLVTDLNGYKPNYDPEDKGSYYPGITETGLPIYNPIQCGDFGDNTPQIIDYVYKEDYLYIKMKAQEWFFYTNIQANGYIEVKYYFDENGAVLVDNVYTDFSQFYNLDTVKVSRQETPATYFVYPLNYFYCETKQGTIFDNNVGAQDGTCSAKASLRDSVGDKYYYALTGKNVKNSWCAFVNENKFGVGIYMPNADRYIASRGAKSNSYYAEEANSIYRKKYFNFDTANGEIVPSYATSNYNYINPGIDCKLINFEPLEYSYALFIGDTKEMGGVFSDLTERSVITNANLKDPTVGWPRK